MSHREKNKIIAFLVAIGLIGFGWGFYQSSDGTSAINIVENDSQRAFNELLDNVENMDVLTSKVLVTSSTSQMSKLLSSITTSAYVAQENLAQLPVDHDAIAKTQKFINQLGDYSSSLMNNTVNNVKPTDDQLNTLDKLNKELTNVSISLHSLAEEEDNPLTWKDMKKSLSNASAKTAELGIADKSLSDINSNLTKLPTLNYDGPFSDHMENKDPITLTGKKISWPEAKSLALKYFNDPKGTKYKASEYEISGTKATIPVLTVKLTPIISTKKDDADAVYVDISQRGGFPVLITAPKDVKENKITINQATKTAQEYINKTPYKNMKPNYSMIDNNILTINFVYNIDNTVVYPDMVKVAVSMSNGEIIGMEAQKYLINHKERVLSKDVMSISQARSKLNKGLTLLQEAPCIIPIPGDKEAQVYEFRVKDKNSKEYLIYLSQKDGQELDILEIIYTDGGIFTI